MNTTIAVVGSLNADLVVHVARHPKPGETLPGSGGAISPGGKGANQAVAAALLGGDVVMIGAVGDDPNAAPTTSLLRAAGVDLAHVRTHPGPTGIAIVMVDARGENSIIVIPGANASTDATAVDAAAAAITAAAVVVLQGEIPRSGIERAAALARGRLVVNLAPVVEVDRAVLMKANPLVVNEHEAALTLHMLGGPRHSEGSAPAHVAADLLAQGVRSVVVTLGAEGALVGEQGSLTAVPSPQIDVVDTTGAGDAFVGALAVRLAQGDSLPDAAAFAARVGAYACTGRGAQPSYPTLRDIAEER